MATRMLIRVSGMLLLVLLVLAQAGMPASAAPDQAKPQTCWHYTALGDSIGQGLWAVEGYVVRYSNYIQTDTGHCIVLTNLAVSGWTSSNLLNALQTNIVYRASVQNSQVVTWDIGGNDFIAARNQYKQGTCGGIDNQDCLRQAEATFEVNWSAIIREILALRNTHNTIIRTMNLYNPYVDEDMAADSWTQTPDAGNDFQVFKPYVDAINGYMVSTATGSNIPCALVYRAFNGPNGDIDPADEGYLAFDGLHPNDTGHAVIADLFRMLGYAPLAKK